MTEDEAGTPAEPIDEPPVNDGPDTEPVPAEPPNEDDPRVGHQPTEGN